MLRKNERGDVHNLSLVLPDDVLFAVIKKMQSSLSWENPRNWRTLHSPNPSMFNSFATLVKNVHSSYQEQHDHAILVRTINLTGPVPFPSFLDTELENTAPHMYKASLFQSNTSTHVHLGSKFKERRVQWKEEKWVWPRAPSSLGYVVSLSGPEHWPLILTCFSGSKWDIYEIRLFKVKDQQDHCQPLKVRRPSAPAFTTIFDAPSVPLQPAVQTKPAITSRHCMQGLLQQNDFRNEVPTHSWHNSSLADACAP